MSTLASLSTLFANKLPMKKDRVQRGTGVAYTDREVAAARFIGFLVFSCCSDIEISEKFSDEDIAKNSDYKLIADLFTQLSEDGFPDAITAIRRTYRAFEGLMLEDDESYRDFPLTNNLGDRIPRHQSSLTVLFRTALRNLVPRSVLDQLFKLYQSAKDKAAQ